MARPVRAPSPNAVLVALAGALAVQAALGGGAMQRLPVLAVVAVAALAAGAAPWSARTPAALAAAVAALVLADQLDARDAFSPLSDLVFFGALVVGAPALLGRTTAARSRQIAELRARTRELADTEQEAARAARAAEQARLAGEIHTAVAQRMGEIALQASGAEHVADRDPDRALEALADVEATARATLDDLRDVIGRLRLPV